MKFLLAGCGKIGYRHAIQMNRVGKLVAACDTDPHAAHHFQEEFSVPVYQSIEEMLHQHGNADVVAICTPNGFHASQSIVALNKGFHVLCEKPMALHVDDCKAMILASEAAGKKLMVVKQNRFNPPVVAVKNLIEQGRLGKIFNIQINCFWNRNTEYYNSKWRGTKDLDGGTLFTQFSHFIDILFFLAGDVDTASAVKSNFNHPGIIDFEDTGIVNLVMRSGALASMNYSVNSFKKNMEGSITILAEKGSIKIGGEYLNNIEYQSIDGDRVQLAEGETLSNDYGNYKGSMSNHDKVYDNLVDVITSNKDEHAKAGEALKTVEIINKIDANSLSI